MYTQNVNLNVVPAGVRPVIHCSQYDNNLQAIKFALYKNDTVFSVPSGAAVVINGRKPDNTGFNYAATAISGNTATFTVTQQMTAVYGDVLCELRVRTSDQIIGTINFILRVEEAPLQDDTILSDTDIPLIEQAVDIAANLAEYIEATYTNAASAQASATAAAASATAAATSEASAQMNAESVEDLYNSIETAKQNANSAAQAAQDIADELDGMTVTVTTLEAGSSATGSYSNGILSLGIPKGDTGESGVVTTISGIFAFTVGSDGHLYLLYDDSGDFDPTCFTYDDETGHLYYVYDDGEE